MISSRRLALVSMVFVFGAAACGDPSSNASVNTTGAHKPPVIHLSSGSGAGGGARDAAATEAAPAAALPSTADSKMAMFAATNYVYDGTIPTLDGPAPSWYFASGQQPDTERITKLAASLGVQGELRTIPQEQGGGWAVGPEDYSGAVLTVSTDGMLSWWLSAAPTALSTPGCTEDGGGVGGGVAADQAVSSETSLPTPGAPDANAPATTAPFACETPKPPVGVPTKEEALAKAKDLFSSWGYDLDAYQFDEPYADEWNASVNASLLVDGTKAPITLSIGFGGGGAVTWASGTLGTLQQGDDYPTVGAAAGLERLKTQQGQFMAFGQGVATRSATDAVAVPETAVTELASGEAPSTNVGIVAPDIAVPPVCQTATTDECVPANVEPITVTLNSVRRDLTMVWAEDGTIWLLPAYTFTSTDGGFYTVVAVDDAYIDQPDATTVDPATTEPVIEPVNVPGTEVSEPAVTAVVGTTAP